MDKKHQVIIRKSNPKTQNFDTIFFANSDIKTAKIPKTIKYVDSYAFENCENYRLFLFQILNIWLLKVIYIILVLILYFLFVKVH